MKTYDPAIVALFAEPQRPKRAAHKYSPEEPRDYHGRWTDGGDGSLPFAVSRTGITEGKYWRSGAWRVAGSEPFDHWERTGDKSTWVSRDGNPPDNGAYNGDHPGLAGAGAYYNDSGPYSREDYSPEALAAIERYQVGSADMNSALRGGGKGDTEQAATARALDEAFAQTPPLARDLTVYRGVTPQMASRLEGRARDRASFRDKGFVSTSQSLGVAEFFGETYGSESHVVAIHVPAGTHAIPIDRINTEFHSDEWLLPRGGTFTGAGFTRGLIGFSDTPVFTYTPPSR